MAGGVTHATNSDSRGGRLFGATTNAWKAGGAMCVARVFRVVAAQFGVTTRLGADPGFV